MTQSLEDYLEAVYVLTGENRPAQVKAIARAIDVTMPSVVKAIRELGKLGLVEHLPYKGVTLTEKGLRLAKMVHSRHTLLRDFLMKLGVSLRTADRDACLMEHVVSAETLDRIRIYMESK
jgi:DtxR family Mn-dependent transcriptional regulator